MTSSGYSSLSCKIKYCLYIIHAHSPFLSVTYLLTPCLTPHKHYVTLYVPQRGGARNNPVDVQNRWNFSVLVNAKNVKPIRQQADTVYPLIPSSLLLGFFCKIILVPWLEVATCQWTVHQLTGDVSSVCVQRQILCCSGALSALQLRQADDGSTQGLYG